ncbi:hypothetical protein [Niabella hibiscisoli]|uniref:hypothetical protein n=1 Tax=Niabella hibiscisoli TaxID=1825928 RepID=UPI001F102C34|nr:hypothetical protein [Niabella hibiscisoli]MCH5721399.1 hypothetical protein [Niabella hibiscisoli]
MPVYIVSSAAARLKPAIGKTGFNNVTILSGDNTMIRTAARTNPTVYVLNKGTIIDKRSYKNFDKVSF